MIGPNWREDEAARSTLAPFSARLRRVSERDHHPHQIGQRARPHFLHDTRAMDFDGSEAYFEASRDCLVGFAIDDEAHDFVLAWRERTYSACDFGENGQLLANGFIALESSFDTLEQIIFAQRFLEEFEGASTQRSDCDRNGAVTSDENRRNPPTAAVKLLLQLETGHVRHPHVKNDAATLCRVIL
jgi:hypothetical protein